MATLFAPRFYARPEPNFRGLFRLLDEFDQYSAQNTNRSSRHVQVFNPRFDLKETETTYELLGELPGVDKENVNIEFSDPQTIVIRGKVERSFNSGAPAAPAAAETVEAKPDETSGAITNSDEEPVIVDHEESSETTSVKSHQATVEDEPEEGAATEVQNTPATTVAETEKPVEPAEAPKPAAPKSKYWVSERSVGQFSRSFRFPSRVEHEAVSAAMSNGVLTVSVPKAKKHESRRIAIF